MEYSVLEVKVFERDLLKIARKHPIVIDLVESLFADLEEGKFYGDRIPGLKGRVVYKTRLSNPNASKRKSGGFRVIWYLVTSDSEIYPLTIYSKNDQEDISVKEITRIIDRILEDEEIYLYGNLVRETDSNQFPEGSELAMTLADQWKEKMDRLTSLKRKVDEKRPLSTEIIRELKEDILIKSTCHSNAIEGNTLTIYETKAVLEDGITIAGKSMREHLEVLNHREAILIAEEIVHKEAPFSELVIKELHGIVLNNIDRANAGKYRD
ncbi:MULTISPECIES: hypothetical protein [unclassified Sporosarcina]|uniref:hypothetical protein n=1 Tax=unclassified Sporosarcina TaxID=2647733 RepID=UPI00203CA057|nr:MULTISPECIES: hypothetical protein [unclassified Sporosarcina]GKV65540.1 hypothetical protein NCCP2331_16930 [Sporosarcina sp. NCCP-2331]GLB55665.1 hypothetical protein NCCP2378_14520 [Sporosarcina sp. NCCP-2378]